MKVFNGGVTSALGYKAVGTHIGLKKNEKKDLALILSDVHAIAAGAFTKNVVKAAPVLWDERIIEQGNTIKGIVINSKNANACTGVQGEQDVRAMAECFAHVTGALSDEILVASTGVIGVPLPMDIILRGIENTAKLLDSSLESGTAAAQAIMTTDTFSKQIAVEFEINGKKITIGAMAKGSGMIHPNMATLLSFVTTDINISKDLLQKAVSEIVKYSYNMISVDRDTSTNDSLIVIANGMAQNDCIIEDDENYNIFKKALAFVNIELAKAIARDGEGATKFIEVTVTGTSSESSAAMLAKSVISSNLVKTAMFGEDANWGRILAALGYSGASFDPTKVDIILASKNGKIELMTSGTPIAFNEELAAEILKEKDISIYCNLNSGHHTATAWGCDLSYDYVKINGEYRT